jgi:hypothetical protein
MVWGLGLRADEDEQKTDDRMNRIFRMDSVVGRTMQLRDEC